MSSPSSYNVDDPSSSSSSSGIRMNVNRNGDDRRRRRRRRPPTPPPPPPPWQPPHYNEEASTSTYNLNGGVWPEPFVEALALQLAVDTSLNHGRLAVGPALAILFQVCSTWRTVSRSELLWQNLVSIVWDRTDLLHPTWRDQFIYHHCIARNFRVYRCSYNVLHPSDHPSVVIPVGGGGGEEGGVVDQLPVFCLRLALSSDHLAAGFSNGSVRYFHLPSTLHLRTIQPHHRDHLGVYSWAVSGLILDSTIDHLVFASLDGDVYVASPLAGPGPARRAYVGDVVNDGALVDFAGSRKFWVGLYAGLSSRAFRVWDAESEALLFVGGSLTDPDSVMGWHMLAELRLAEALGRVRVSSIGQAVAVAATSLRVLVLDLEEEVMAVGEEAVRRGVIVGSVDSNNEAFVMVDTRGMASVRRVQTLEEVCRFTVTGRGGGSVQLRGLIGCMNSMYVAICVGGVIRVWDAENGEYLYSLRERMEETSAIVASDRYVVASCDTTIHLWDFGAAN